jgi:hypothetical protein
MFVGPRLHILCPPDGAGGEPLERQRKVWTGAVPHGSMLAHPEHLCDFGDPCEPSGLHARGHATTAFGALPVAITRNVYITCMRSAAPVRLAPQ